MDKCGDKKRVLTSRHKEDRLSNLPESLLCRIMLNLRTKDVVQSCVLSKRWRNLWKYVPGLSVECRDFGHYKTFVNFVNMFLVINRERYFQSCRLKYYSDEDERIKVHVKDWIKIVSYRKVKELVIIDDISYEKDDVRIPKAIYTCESLVSLDLENVILVNPKLISLPFLKVIKLHSVEFDDALVLEKLISSCPVLESVCINESYLYNIGLLRVCSQSLLSFKYNDNHGGGWEHLQVEIDAPKLEHLILFKFVPVSFRIKSLESLVEADIGIRFDMEYPRDLNDIPKINMIRDFLRGISCVKKLSISVDMVQVIFGYIRCGQPLPIFHNLYFLHPVIWNLSVKMLSSFLESCPNLKSLVLNDVCLLTSLEYVKIESLITGKTEEMELVSYFLMNSTILKKLILRLEFGGYEKKEDIFKKLLTITRLSPSCQVVVL